MSSSGPVSLGPYRLLNVVHTGHAGQLWQAYDDAERRFVAVKTLSERFRNDREQLGYMKREYVIGSKLIHERIIRVFKYGNDRGTPYLAMEWFVGGTMRSRLRQGLEMMLPWIPKIVLQATEAVAFTNSQGWIHRDIKPDNFLVGDDGEVKLIDFALAQKKPGLLGALLPRPKSKVQGTRSYMAPEQIRGMRLDDRADLYSLGCTLFELVAGKPPYSGATTRELLSRHLKAPPPPLENLNPNVTMEFAQLIRSALQKEPAARPRSTDEFYQKVRKTPVFRGQKRPDEH